MKRVAVAGGGAAGLTAAIIAARRGCAVTVWEASDRVGKKILASGNGKCNLMHESVGADSYNDPAARAIVERVGAARIRAFFEEMGMPLRTDGEGRVYPYGEQSSLALNVLRAAIERVGVRVSCPVVRLVRAENGWLVNGEKFDAVIWATGSAATMGADSLDVLRALKIPCKPFAPSLAPLLTEGVALGGLKGVRVKASACLIEDGVPAATESGEILFKDNGLSGIAAFNLSARIARRAAAHRTVLLDCFPDLAERELEGYLAINADGVAHKELLKLARLQGGATAYALKNLAFPLRGVGHLSLAQVCSGGVPLAAMDAQLQALPALYVVGEAADVDGLCGGYNLMWAWASGMIAGESV